MNKDIFVQNIKFYCDKKGVKETVACLESGAGKQFMQHLKNGSEPSIGKVEMLAHYLGTTVSELIGETATPKPRTLADLPPDALAVAKAYVGAAPDDRLIVDTVLKKYRV